MKTLNLALIITLFSCSTQREDTIDKNLSSISTFSYETPTDSTKITRSFEKIYENGVLQYSSEQLIKKKFDSNKNLIEQIDFDVENGDTTVSRFLNHNYNELNQLIAEYDSNSLFITKGLNEYADGKRIKDSTLRIYFYRDFVENEYKVVSIDSTISNTIRHFIDTTLVATTSIEWDLPMVKLVENYFPDTTFSYLQYDDNGNNYQSISISKRDTIFASKTKFDEEGRTIFHATIHAEIGQSNLTYEYDNNGNVIVETNKFDFMASRRINTYDDQNRLIETKDYMLQE